jgi:hypothetical protein
VAPIIENITACLVAKRLASLSETVGCTTDEIEELEHREGVHFPAVYKEFLLRMGRSAGRFLRELMRFIDTYRDCGIG